MAPEQAKGQAIDKRADIWAYGAVLFEMLTGRKLFEASDVSEMLASVLVKDPDISSLGGHVPAHIRSVVRQCLVKDPKERLRDIGDVRLAMKGVFETSASRALGPPATPAPRLWQRPVPLVLAGLALLGVGGVTGWGVMRAGDTPADLMRFEIATPESAPLRFSPGRALALSADGSQIVYDGVQPGGSGRQIYVRPIDQLDVQALRGTEGGANPFVSPDGLWVGFQAGTGVSFNTLQKVSIFGGPPVTLATLPSFVAGASWGADDQIIVGTIGGGLFRVPGGGGEPVALTTPDSGQAESHRRPSIIPDRQAVLFAVWSGGLADSQLAVLALETGDVTHLGLAGTAPRYVETGHLIYAAADGSVRAVPFDASRLEVNGSPVPLIDADVVTPTGAANFSISNAGRLVYVPGGGAAGLTRTLAWVDRDGGEELLTDLSSAGYWSVDLSPDGTRLALEIADAAGTASSDV